MLFIWGKKVQTERLGYVGDFCPICREVRTFRLEEVRLVRHLYYVPIGRIEAAGHQIECAACGVALRAEPEDFPTLSQDASAEARALATRASPRISAHIAKRQDLEDRARLRRLSAEERAALILEPFQLLEPKLAARLMRTNLDARSGGALLATFALPILFFYAAGRSQEPFSTALEWAAILSIAAGLGATAALAATDGRRFFQRSLEPLLARCLGVLEPSLEELTAAIEKLRAQDTAVGKKAQAQRLWDAIETALKGPVGPN